MKVLGDVISSLEGLDRGDLEIGEPSDEEFDIDDIPDDATDVFRVTPRKNQLDGILKVIG